MRLAGHVRSLDIMGNAVDADQPIIGSTPVYLVGSDRDIKSPEAILQAIR